MKGWMRTMSTTKYDVGSEVYVRFKVVSASIDEKETRYCLDAIERSDYQLIRLNALQEKVIEREADNDQD